jgi:DNA-binding transcriptional MocR family regulator
MRPERRLRVLSLAGQEIMMIDRQGDPATEYAITELIETGELRRHMRKVLKIYGERRAYFADLLLELFDGNIEFSDHRRCPARFRKYDRRGIEKASHRLNRVFRNIPSG